MLMLPVLRAVSVTVAVCWESPGTHSGSVAGAIDLLSDPASLAGPVSICGEHASVPT